MPMWLASILTVVTVGGLLLGLHLLLDWIKRTSRLPDPMDEPFGDVPNPRGRG